MEQEICCMLIILKKKTNLLSHLLYPSVRPFHFPEFRKFENVFIILCYVKIIKSKSSESILNHCSDTGKLCPSCSCPEKGYIYSICMYICISFVFFFYLPIHFETLSCYSSQRARGGRVVGVSIRKTDQGRVLGKHLGIVDR